MKESALSRSSRFAVAASRQGISHLLHHGRYAHSDAVQRRSKFWMPTVQLSKENTLVYDTTQLLARAGYLRQAYSGIYHMLPLGLRVQNKIEQLIDKHMRSIGASKLSLSSISSQDLWERSGRLASGTEFFKFSDRKGAKWLLCPTHEEEITSVVGQTVQSFKDLPVRVYQVSRKYRDERRPRGGLLRGREFLMKDLYTFDLNDEAARATYNDVRKAYANIFNELRVDFLEAQADSGDMGGSLSHEYHLAHASGEDNIIRCTNCDFARNEELVDEVEFERKKLSIPYISSSTKSTETAAEKVAKDAVAFATADVTKKPPSTAPNFASYTAITKDRTTLVRAFAPTQYWRAPVQSPDEIGDFGTLPPRFNAHVIKAAFEGHLDIDTGIEGATGKFLESIVANRSAPVKKQHSIHYLIDSGVDSANAYHQIEQDYDFMGKNDIVVHTVFASDKSPNKLHLSTRRPGDVCPNCHQKTLDIQKAIEVGHTFHLGTRYSSKLGANVVQSASNESTPIEMGCHGIGVSRLVAAIAACLSDEKGLNWPRAIAPFQVAILTKRELPPALVESVMELSHKISSADHQSPIDVLFDDRETFNLGWKMNDADVVGYPVLVIFGKAWDAGKDTVEVQCRRLSVKENVAFGDVPDFVQQLLQRL